jgi:hypothetical protein
MLLTFQSANASATTTTAAALAFTAVRVTSLACMRGCSLHPYRSRIGESADELRKGCSVSANRRVCSVVVLAYGHLALILLTPGGPGFPYMVFPPLSIPVRNAGFPHGLSALSDSRSLPGGPEQAVQTNQEVHRWIRSSNEPGSSLGPS